jgi:hypothetical protein
MRNTMSAFAFGVLLYLAACGAVSSDTGWGGWILGVFPVAVCHFAAGFRVMVGNRPGYRVQALVIAGVSALITALSCCLALAAASTFPVLQDYPSVLRVLPPACLLGGVLCLAWVLVSFSPKLHNAEWLSVAGAQVRIAVRNSAESLSFRAVCKLPLQPSPEALNAWFARSWRCARRSPGDRVIDLEAKR